MTEYPPTCCPSCGAELDAGDAPRYECPDCGNSVWNSPAVAAAVAVVDLDSERILLGERGVPPSEGRLSTPGGHVELGEEPEADDDLASVRWVDVDERREVPWAFSGYEGFVTDAMDALTR